jgi:arginine deiminase
MMDDIRISDLTVHELRQLIRETVQEAVAEVLIEFQAVARAEEQLQFEAEMTEYLRNTMQELSPTDTDGPSPLDD